MMPIPKATSRYPLWASPTRITCCMLGVQKLPNPCPSMEFRSKKGRRFAQISVLPVKVSLRPKAEEKLLTVDPPIIVVIYPKKMMPATNTITMFTPNLIRHFCISKRTMKLAIPIPRAPIAVAGYASGGPFKRKRAIKRTAISAWD